MVPRGSGACCNTSIGDAALASRQRWGLTSSLMPAAWLIQVDQTRRRVHGEPETPGEVELHRGDSFLIIWEEDGWTLFERYPGDVAAWTTTVMPAGTEVSHHNHILLPSQQVYDGEIPQAAAPDANGSQARGHRSGDSTPHKAAPPRPPSSSTSSGNRSERAWASEDGRDQPEGEHDRTELMQRNPPHPHGGSPPNKPAYTTATAAAPHSGASEELEPWRSSSNHRKRGQPTPAQHPPQQAPEAEHPLFGAPSTQTQEEMLAVAHLVETGQANSVAWTGGRNPCQDMLEATVPETTLTQQQRGQSPGSPTRKRSRTGTSQQQPDPEPSAASASKEQEQGQNNTAASQQPHPEHHQPTRHFPQQQALGQSNTAVSSQQQHPEHHQPAAALPHNRGQQQQESSAYMVLRAQQLVAQLMPTLVGDQVPLAAEALSQLQSWTRGLWGHDIQLVGDSATDSCGSMADTVPWQPPEPARGPVEGPARPQSNPGPAGKQSRGRGFNDCSLASADMPGTETEDEAFGLQRRRRSTTARARRRSTAPTTEREAETADRGSGTEGTSHRRRRLHAAMTDD